MRIAVVSDIHANLTALDAVVADLKQVAPDLVVVGGDLVGSGSRPAEVVDRVRDLGWPAIGGNTDDMLWNSAQVDAFFSAPALRPWRAVVDRSIAATAAALGDTRVKWLKTLPGHWSDGSLSVVHAAPGDLWRAPGPDAADEEFLRTYSPLGTPRVVYGHIHRSFVRRLPGLTVANSGSVSLAYDGDRRAAYAIVNDDGIVIRRVEYDVEAEIASLMSRQCPDAAWIADMLRVGAPLPISANA